MFSKITPASLLALASLAAYTQGCSEKEPIALGDGRPVVQDPDAGAAPKRTVSRRSPFGDLTADNLLLDGDFEFTGRQGQMPWLALGDRGQGTMGYGTGGLCASGTRCGKLESGEGMFGWMSSPKSGSFEISLLVKPGNGDCEAPNVEVYVLDLDTGTGVAEVRSSGLDEASGFCRFEGVARALPFANPGLYIEATRDAANPGPSYVDRVVATVVQPGPSTLRSLRPSRLEGERADRMAANAEWIRKHRVFGAKGNDPDRLPDARKLE